MIGYNALEMDEYLDYFNVMSYDFYRGDDSEIQHQASYSETVHALQLWVLHGAPKNKILMGIPAYGVGWIANRCAPGAPVSGPAPAQKLSGEEANAAYFDVSSQCGK
ncbi:hypothetical protein PENTCL1PPCAC_28622, partial [Pristionchus entomophagus]